MDGATAGTANSSKGSRIDIGIASIVVGIAPCFSHTIPVKATIRELTARPSEFDGELVSIDARILSNFEIFSAVDVSDLRCERAWVEMGDEAWATTVTSKSRDPNIQRSPIRPRRDRAFKRFAKLVKAEIFPRTEGSLCIGCNRFDVAARLNARFDFASGHGGFEHLNGWSSRLVVESVSDVRAEDLLGTYDPA